MRAALVVVLPAALLGAWVWTRIRPPELAVPPRGVKLTNVTVDNPGKGRRRGCNLEVVDSTITTVDENARPAASGDRFAGALFAVIYERCFQ